MQLTEFGIWVSRRVLGEGPLLAPELACVLDEDPGRARAEAREHAELYLGLSNYRKAVPRAEWTALAGALVA